MAKYYTDEKNAQIVIALLKEHGIKRVIASPGGTNPAMVISMQSDEFFEMYSCVDERSAAYMACGMAEESNEPVVICCTGATASRNYMPALTEAFYRKIPIVVITCSRPNYNLGHLMPQVTNRNVYPADILVDGEHLQVVKDDKDFWDCEYKINKVLLAMKRHGGGPVHLNVECITQSCTNSTLPIVNTIQRITQNDLFPKFIEGRIGIFIGSHKKMSKDLEEVISKFCLNYNAVVFCDHTSGYYGNYSIPYSLIGTQHKHKFDLTNLDLLIHIGEISGDYLTMENIKAKNVWRINEDGEIRIRFQKLNYIFEMPENIFFQHYNVEGKHNNTTFWEECNSEYEKLYNSIPELPLSHIYIAKYLAPLMPNNCVVHFAILNALRAWNFFKTDATIRTNCNVGGFGIDGCTSSLIGASLANKNKLYYCFTGDLAFFYDLNSLGNRHVGPNVRILLLNDGKGAEFTHFMTPKYQVDKELYVAGGGHFGNQSRILVKQFTENLGFEYMQATTKDEFIANYERFINPAITENPMFFEIIISEEGQSESWRALCNLADSTTEEIAKELIKKGVKSIIKSFSK